MFIERIHDVRTLCDLLRRERGGNVSQVFDLFEVFEEVHEPYVKGDDVGRSRDLARSAVNEHHAFLDAFSREPCVKVHEEVHLL